MKYWFDTEFMASGEFLQLLSIGIVSEDNREFYAVNALADQSKADEFVKAKVLPYLGPIQVYKTPEQIKREIIAFVGQDKQPLFHGYFAAYDWVLFCQLFGSLISLPNGWPQFCIDLMQMSFERGCPPHPKQTGTQHNALEDARWCRVLHRRLDLYPPKCLERFTQALQNENKVLRKHIGTQ